MMVPLHRSKAVSRSGHDSVMAPGLAITMNLVTGLELSPGLVIARTFDQIHAALQSLNIIALLSRSRAAHYLTMKMRPQGELTMSGLPGRAPL